MLLIDASYISVDLTKTDMMKPKFAYRSKNEGEIMALTKIDVTFDAIYCVI